MYDSIVHIYVFLLQPSDSSPSRIHSFRAHIEMFAPPPPPPPIPLVQTPHLKSKSARVVNTNSQLISSHYPSSHPCRSSNSSPPSPPPLLFPAQFVQTPHLQSKSARVINTSKQLISRHYLSSHPGRSFHSSPLPPSNAPSFPTPRTIA